jgi:hypothetical protein
MLPRFDFLRTNSYLMDAGSLPTTRGPAFSLHCEASFAAHSGSVLFVAAESFHIRHEQPIGHSFLKVLEHTRLGGWHADRERLAVS